MGKSVSKELTLAQLAALRKNPVFDVYTDEEIRQWYFRFIEGCPNGRLSKDKFKGIYNDLFPRGDPSHFAEYAFQAFDIDGNGEIDFREFLWGICVMSKARLEHKLEWAFSMYDINGDGHISRKEMIQIVSAIYQMVANDPRLAKVGTDPVKIANAIFDEVDTDKNGQLTMEEFVEGAKKNPEILGLLNY